LGGVGERAGVAPVVEVGADVPVHAEAGDRQREDQHRAGQRGPVPHARHALGDPAEAREHGDAAGAVAEDQREQNRGGDPGRRGGDEHLIDGGAAGRLVAMKESASNCFSSGR
jgi:hypothetical protein